MLAEGMLVTAWTTDPEQRKTLPLVTAAELDEWPCGIQNLEEWTAEKRDADERT
jgi:hypothetical protein